MPVDKRQKRQEKAAVEGCWSAPYMTFKIGIWHVNVLVKGIKPNDAKGTFSQAQSRPNNALECCQARLALFSSRCTGLLQHAWRVHLRDFGVFAHFLIAVFLLLAYPW